MKELSRCKICGYVMETGKIVDVCPACGLPKKVFEPFTPNMSEKRYNQLNLHMHPIMLHFPQAFVITALGLLVLAMIFTGKLHDQLMTVIQFNLLFLPLTVVIGAVTGMKDGKLRYKKTTPLLKFKIKMSVVFLLLSILDAVLVMVLPSSFVSLLILFLVTLLATGNAVILGKTGSKMMETFIPGK